MSPLRGILCAAVLALSSGRAWAAWPTDVHANLPICIAQGTQARPVIATDGANGAIIAWVDSQSPPSDIFANHVNKDGVIQWGYFGQTISWNDGGEGNANILTDGAGGAFIVWFDWPSGDIYAQHISATREPLWTNSGILIAATDVASGDLPELVSDQDGGIIVTWTERFGTTYSYIRSQRVAADGSLLWGPSGVLACDVLELASNPAAVMDGSGGVIMAWTDRRDSTHVGKDIYAQHILSDGSLSWGDHGLAISTTNVDAANPKAISDGSGGAYFAWWSRPASCSICYPNDPYGLFIVRVSPTGEMPWPALSPGVSPTEFITLSPDAQGGAVLTWADGSAYRAQRFTPSGAQAWQSGGITVRPVRVTPSCAIPDGQGGTILGWIENRTVDQYALDVYGQRITADGDFLWGESGAAVSTANLMQEWPVAVSDGWGGAIFTWVDYRNAFGNPTDTKIYAQRISGGGIPGDLWPTSVAATPPTGDLVRCSPNPTSKATSVRYSLTEAGKLRLTVYDAAGRPVRVLRNGTVDSGSHQDLWDGRDLQGRLAPTGVYFVLLESETLRSTSKLLVVR